MITAQLYRHFAVWTVALTGLTAFLANCEKQQTIATEAAARAPAKPDNAGSKTPPLASGDQDTSTWAPEYAGDFGRPMIDTGVARGSWNPFASEDSHPPPADGESSEADDAKPVGQASPSASEVAAATAASRLRGGGHD